jgi:hypothetical protein
MSRIPDDRNPINDPATQLALERLGESRQQLASWTARMSARMAARREAGSGLGGFGFGAFEPRSQTLKMLMSLVLPRLPWLRMGLTTLLPLLLRFWRRR